MCHLILLMPLLALPVFWLLPLPAAVLTYAGVAALSGWLYWLAFRAMRRPVVTGSEGLVGSIEEVVEAHGRHVSVRVHGEVWNAKTKDKVRKGDKVRVGGVDGLVLSVLRPEQQARRPKIEP
jgi:inner membrane protein